MNRMTSPVEGLSRGEKPIAEAAPDHFPWDLLIPVLPELLALLLLVIAILIIGPTHLAGTLRRVRKVAIAGLELELAEDVEAAAIAKNQDLSASQPRRIAQLLADAAPILSCSRLLWVDDNPANNRHEIRALRRVCVAIDLARSTDEARGALRKGIYDLVVSDMRRGDTELAGEEILGDVAGSPFPPDIIYYVGVSRPAPEGAFGLTVKPDELFRLLVDAMRRRRS